MRPVLPQQQLQQQQPGPSQGSSSTMYPQGFARPAAVQSPGLFAGLSGAAAAVSPMAAASMPGVMAYRAAEGSPAAAAALGMQPAMADQPAKVCCLFVVFELIFLFCLLLYCLFLFCFYFCFCFCFCFCFFCSLKPLLWHTPHSAAPRSGRVPPGRRRRRR